MRKPAVDTSLQCEECRTVYRTAFSTPIIWMSNETVKPEFEYVLIPLTRLVAYFIIHPPNAVLSGVRFSVVRFQHGLV